MNSYRDAGDGCIEWPGARQPGRGYGRFGLRSAHRMAYEASKGPIPPGLVIDHLCRNTGCVNPRHLEAVTQRENVLRGNCANHGLCRKGLHPWPEGRQVKPSGRTYCGPCNRLYCAAYGRRRVAA